MKIAREITEALCNPPREQDMDDIEAIIAAKLEPVREVLDGAKMCLPDADRDDETWEWAWDEL